MEKQGKRVPAGHQGSGQDDDGLPLHALKDGVLTITLNRPQKLNALTYDIYAMIARLVEEASTDDDCRVVVLRGAGRAFSSGFDLKLEVKAKDPEHKLRMVHDIANRARWAIWNCRKPVVAALHGYCLAGAFELVMPSDFAIATESCRLGEPEILFGAGPAFMMVPWMVNHKRAKDVLLTGRQFGAREALEMDFVTSVVPDDALDAEVDRLVELLRKLPPAAVWLVKAGINRAYETQGLQTHLNGWAETAALLSMMDGEAKREFSKRVLEEGTGAGLKWRETFFKPNGKDGSD